MNEYPPESSALGVPCAYDGATPSRNRHTTAPPTLIAAPFKKKPRSVPFAVLNGHEE
jgi:hypothetical protein